MSVKKYFSKTCLHFRWTVIYVQTKTQIDWYLETKRQRFKWFLKLEIDDKVGRRMDHCLFFNVEEDVELINKINKCNEVYDREYKKKLRSFPLVPIEIE